MTDELSSIENRPEELKEIPYYEKIPDVQIVMDIGGMIGEFLNYDLLDLAGIQPIESKHLSANKGIIKVNPSKESIEIYRKKNTKFQLVSVVINAFGFKKKDDVIHAKPYSISLKVGTKRDKIEEKDIDLIEKFDLEGLESVPKYYAGFNPFTNAYGVYAMGTSSFNQSVESDMIGFVYKMYFLATEYNHRDVCPPSIPELEESNQASRDYQKYRKDRYFKKFTKDKPRKIWGCDSPIELFLLQAMDHMGLSPEIQTIICEDGVTYPSFHKLWENKKSRKRLKIVTEADFYFPNEKLAIFCDSKSHHSSQEAIDKDKAIDSQLIGMGIRSLRILGPEIVKSPFGCANIVKNALSKDT